MAERYIRFIKSRLSACMASLGTKEWHPMLKPLVDRHNGKKIPPTSFRRKDIDSSNFHRFMEQKLGLSDYANFLNSSRINARAIKNERWLKKMFRYREGETVLVSARVDRQGTLFLKPSVKGYFREGSYSVAERYLATTRDLKLIPGRGGGGSLAAGLF
jgi:hypothetical protein